MSAKEEKSDTWHSFIVVLGAGVRGKRTLRPLPKGPSATKISDMKGYRGTSGLLEPFK